MKGMTTTGRGRGVLAAGTLLAALALAACESAEDQEIRKLIEEIAALQEQAIAVMEATAEEEVADRREHDPGSVAQTERRWEREVQTTRARYEETLARLRGALASGDWETAYPEENGSPLAVVAARRDLAEESVRWAEGRRASRASSRERMAEIRARAERGSDARRRVPDPSTWMPRQEPPSVDEVLGRLWDDGAGRETGR